MTVVLDDHLLRDWMARRDGPLVDAVAGDAIATTNLWYVRLCRSAARAAGGALLEGWADAERGAFIAGLVALPNDVAVVPMRDLAWSMGRLSAMHVGLSALGAEAVAAALNLGARILVSSKDDGPSVRRCCESTGVEYGALLR